MRKYLRELTVVIVSALIVAAPVDAQNPWSTAAMQAWKQSITSAGYMGAPRYTTALLPTCNAANTGGVALDTTTSTLKFCQGSAWTEAAGSTLPIADTTGVVKGSADATKILRFEVDGFTTGTTRVATFPNADITVAGQNFANTFSATMTTNNQVAFDVGSPLMLTIYPSSQQTPDSAVLAVGTLSRGLLIVESGDGGFDFAHAQQTNPTLFIHSANQSTTEYAAYTHLGQAPNRVTVTVDTATTFAITTGYVVLACTGAETINTITGGITGAVLYIENSDTECTIADDDAATAANAIDLAGTATNDVGAVAKVITLIYNGSHWLQVSESDN